MFFGGIKEEALRRGRGAWRQVVSGAFDEPPSAGFATTGVSRVARMHAATLRCAAGARLEWDCGIAVTRDTLAGVARPARCLERVGIVAGALGMSYTVVNRRFNHLRVARQRTS